MKMFWIFSPKIKKNYWMVTEMCLPFSSWVGLNAHWKVTELCLKSVFQWTFREHSVDIKKCFSRLEGEFSSFGVQRRCHISNIVKWIIFYSIAFVLRDCGAVLSHCWIYFILWWGFWYANMSSSDNKSV